MSIDLRALSDSVHDEATFLRFLTALATDWHEERVVEMANPSPPYSPGALGWENGTIGAMLEAAAGGGMPQSTDLSFMKNQTIHGVVRLTSFMLESFMSRGWRSCAQRTGHDVPT